MLGNGDTANSSVPVPVAASGIGNGEKFIALASGPSACHGTALTYDGTGRRSGVAISKGTDATARVPTDVVGTLGTGIDSTVQKITYHYDNHMRLSKVGSYATPEAETPLNEVSFGYNSFGQFCADRQEHDGAVDGDTLKVGYSYESGGNNTLRSTGMIYPSGVSTKVKYTGTEADKLSRPDVLALGVTDEVSYRYLGLGRVVGTSYTAIATDPVEMTYETGTGTASDKYSGLDNFGRVVEVLWEQGTAVIENVTYGYNRASNRQWRRNQLAHNSGGAEAGCHDNFYWYDGLYQVVQRQLGNLLMVPPNPYDQRFMNAGGVNVGVSQ